MCCSPRPHPPPRISASGWFVIMQPRKKPWSSTRHSMFAWLRLSKAEVVVCTRLNERFWRGFGGRKEVFEFKEKNCVKEENQKKKKERVKGRKKGTSRRGRWLTSHD